MDRDSLSIALLALVVGCGGNPAPSAERPPSARRGPWSVQCPLGPATAAPEPIGITLGLDPRRAAEIVSSTLRALGYQNESAAPGVWRTTPRLTWPIGAPDSLSRHPYPVTGVELILGMTRRGDSAAVLGGVTALCRSDATSPDSTESIAERLDAEPLREGLRARRPQ